MPKDAKNIIFEIESELKSFRLGFLKTNPPKV